MNWNTVVPIFHVIKLTSHNYLQCYTFNTISAMRKNTDVLIIKDCLQDKIIPAVLYSISLPVWSSGVGGGRGGEWITSSTRNKNKTSKRSKESNKPYSVVVQKQTLQPPKKWKPFQFADVIFRQINRIKLILKWTTTKIFCALN